MIARLLASVMLASVCAFAWANEPDEEPVRSVYVVGAWVGATGAEPEEIAGRYGLTGGSLSSALGVRLPALVQDRLRKAGYEIRGPGEERDVVVTLNVTHRKDDGMGDAMNARGEHVPILVPVFRYEATAEFRRPSAGGERRCTVRSERSIRRKEPKGRAATAGSGLSSKYETIARGLAADIVKQFRKECAREERWQVAETQ